MIFEDLAGMPDVTRFIERQLKKVDSAGIVQITLKKTLRYFPWTGRCRPTYGGYHIKANTMSRPSLSIRTRCMKCWRRYDSKKCSCEEPRGVYVFRSNKEIIVQTVGHEVFHYLVYTEQHQPFETIEEEEAGADEYGLDWVRRWRCGAASRARRSA